jgi:hypothetical protein
MKSLLIIYFNIAALACYCQVVNNNKLPARQLPRTWKTDSLNVVSKFKLSTIVPANYQATIPAPLTTEGLFTIFSPLLSQNDKRVLPDPTGNK